MKSSFKRHRRASVTTTPRRQPAANPAVKGSSRPGLDLGSMSANEVLSGLFGETAKPDEGLPRPGTDSWNQLVERARYLTQAMQEIGDSLGSDADYPLACAGMVLFGPRAPVTPAELGVLGELMAEAFPDHLSGLRLVHAFGQSRLAGCAASA